MITFAGYPCLDPKDLARAYADAELPPGPWWGRANSYVCPLGEGPGVAHLVMDRESFAKIDQSVTQTLVFDDGTTVAAPGAPGQQATVGTNRTPIKYLKVARGSTEDVTVGTQAAVFFRAEDWRGWVNPYFSSDDEYSNSAFDSTTNYLIDNSTQFVTLSLTSPGVLQTWYAMVADLWRKCFVRRFCAYNFDFNTFKTFPGLPFTPQGVPVRFDYTPIRGTYWHALNDVLTRLGCALRYNPVANTLGIVRLGVPDGTAQAAIADAKRRYAIVARTDRAGHQPDPTIFVLYDKFIEYDYGNGIGATVGGTKRFIRRVGTADPATYQRNAQQAMPALMKDRTLLAVR